MSINLSLIHIYRGKMKKITVTYPLLIVSALALAFDKNGWLILYLAAAALHELGHLAAILLYGGRVQDVYKRQYRHSCAGDRSCTGYQI